MRIHALLNWFDEPPSALAATIASLHHANVDSIIAIDGAYALYPSSHAISPPDQSQLIHMVARELGMTSTIHTPTRKWDGGEVEKRTALFALAEAVSDDGDWWFVIDADEVVTSAPTDLKARLEHTEHHVAQATLTQLRNLDEPGADTFNWARAGSYPFRMLFRAQPMRCHTNHYTYVTADNRVLWCSDSARQEPALDINDLHVEHRDNQRHHDRKEDKRSYYQRRDKLGIERSPCKWEGCEQRSTRNVATSFRIDKTRGGFTADLIEACDDHAPRYEKRNRIWLRQHGIDPDEALAHTHIVDPVAA